MSLQPPGGMKVSEMVDHLADAYEAVTRDLSRLEPEDYVRRSGCEGWTIAELLFHMLLDTQRALLTVATPSEAPPDVDYVTYWKPFRAETKESIAHARYVRKAAAAYSSPDSIFLQWSETARAAVRATALIPEGSVETQGHVLATKDFIATLVVEASVHHLDLIHGIGDHDGPARGPMSIVRLTLDGLLGSAPPSNWDDTIYALKATGRLPLGGDDLRQLGAVAERFPLFS